MVTVKKHSMWVPTRPTSRGATAYHNAVTYSSWHKQNIKELIKIVKNKVKAKDIIVDFGAGTGASAIYLLKHLEKNSKLLLVDNSASWLGKAFEILRLNKNVEFYLLEKKKAEYLKLHEIIGKKSADHILSANTVHLIPDIKETFKGIYSALKDKGTFTFQSGNIMRARRNSGVLMIEDTIKEVHDIAIDIIRSDNSFKKYNRNLGKRIEQEKGQRKFVFPDPRPIEYYLKNLKEVGFVNIKVTHKTINVRYSDWLSFLRVRRLQAGILPEVGGRDASEQEGKDRDEIIKKASLKLFSKLKKQNRFANDKFFKAEWIYIQAKK